MKTIFAILATDKSDAMTAAIQRAYPNEHLALGDHQWLVADEGTAQSVSNKLGVTGVEPAPVKAALVVAVSGYFGRQSPPVWEWIKAKWGSE